MDDNLHRLIVKLKNEDLCRAELNELIQRCLNIATSYIIFKYFSTNEPPLKYDFSIQDLAIDSITPLFIKNRSGKIGLLHSIENWDYNKNDEPEILFILNKIIWNRVEQTVVKLIKQRDPIFAKIHKNISACVSNYGFKKISYFGTIYIVKKDKDKHSGNLIPPEKFAELPGNLFLKKQADLCNDILRYLENFTFYFPAIPMNQFVVKLKTLHFSNNLTVDHIDSMYEQHLDINSACEKALKNIKKKLDNFYVKNKKISQSEADSIHNAFVQIADDMKNGGLNSTLYDFLKDEIEELKKEEFYKKYHGIVNYLLNIFKNELLKFVGEKI